MQLKSWQVSVSQLMGFTLVVAIWISGIASLRDSAVFRSFAASTDSRLFVVITIIVVPATICTVAFVFIIYGLLLLMVLAGDSRKEAYLRAKLTMGWRITLIGVIAVTPWLIMLFG